MPSQNPKASVILPIYNGEKYLVDCINSILHQTFEDFEILMLNDGSKDKTLEICEQFASIDARCKIHSRENKGLVHTLNEGIEKSKGTIIFRMDADDICKPERFSRQIKYLAEHPECVAVGTAVTLIDPEGWEIMDFPVILEHAAIDQCHLQGKGGAIAHPSAAIKKEALTQIGGYDDAYKHAEDVDLFLKLAEIGVLANIKEPLLFYRQHLESIGYARRNEQILSAQKSISAACARRGIKNPTSTLTSPAEKSTIFDIYSKWAWWSLSGKNIKTAKKYASYAFRQRPLDLSTWKLWYCIIRESLHTPAAAQADA